MESISFQISSIKINPGKSIYLRVKKSPAYIQVRTSEIGLDLLLRALNAGNDFSFNNEVHRMGRSRQFALDDHPPLCFFIFP